MTKKLIIKYLKDKGVYESIYDRFIDEVIFNFKLIRESKKVLREEGLLVNGSKDGSFKVKNQIVGVYNDAVKNVQNLSRKLGLTPLDLRNLGKESGEEDDGFDF